MGAQMKIDRVAIIGLGLLGGAIGLAVQGHAPGLITHGYDHDPDTRARAKERGLVSHVCDTAQAAVRDAAAHARPGDVILLSPACSSFDQFQDYAERGRVFKQCVQAL